MRLRKLTLRGHATGGGTAPFREVVFALAFAYALALLGPAAARAATVTPCTEIKETLPIVGITLPLTLNWSPNSSWTCGKAPNNTPNQVFAVTIPKPDTMNLDVAATIGQGGGKPLTVQSGATLNIGQQQLTINGGGTISNDGTIYLQGGGLTLAGSTSFTVTLSSNSSNGIMYLNGSGSSIAAIKATGAVNQTLVNNSQIVNSSLTGGEIGSGSRLLLQNSGVISSGGSITLDAAPVVSQGQPTIVNNGSLIAQSGGKLNITGQSVENYSGVAGTVRAAGLVTLTSSKVLDGNVVVSAGGELVLAGAILTHNASTLSISNAGTIVTRGGSGQIDLGAGDSFSNKGTIQAMEGALTISGGGQTWQNAGTIQMDGAGVVLKNGVFQGGTYSAGGGALSLEGVTLSASTSQRLSLFSSPSGTIQTVGGSQSTIRLAAGDAFSNTGTIIVNSGALTLDGGGRTWGNDGVIQANGGTMILQNGVFQGGVYSAAAGTLRLNGGLIEGQVTQPKVTVASGAALVGNGALFLAPGTTFSNRGVITADASAPLMINGGAQTWSNRGTIEAIGGILNLSNGTFQSGTFAAMNGGTLQLGATIGHASGAPLAVNTSADGTITGYVTGQILLGAGDSFSNKGTISTSQGNLTLNLGGQTWTNAGTIQVNGGNLTLQNGVLQGGAYSASTGTFRLNNAFIQGGATQPEVNVANGATLTGSGGVFLGAGGTFANSGTIMADAGGLTLSINGGGQAWSNGGTIESNGAILSLTNGTWHGGTFAADGGTLQLGATIASGAGALTVSTSPTGVITGYVNGQILLTAGDTFLNNGLITSRFGNLTLDAGGRTWNNAGTIQAPAGTITLRNGTFQGGLYELAGGNMALNNATIQSNGAAAATVNIQGVFSATGGSSTLNLTAGHFTNQGLVETTGGSLILAGRSGAFANDGTMLASSGLLSLTGTWENNGRIETSSALGAVQIAGALSNIGTISIASNGELQLNASLMNAGRVSLGMNSILLGGTSDIVNESSATFLITGGALETAGTVTNQKGAIITGFGTLSAGVWNNSGQITFSHSESSVFGAVNNEGEISNHGGTVRFTGTVTNDGVYTSDPADNYFEDLIVNSSGYLLAGAGDRFLIDGNFLNSSTQAGLWNTRQAEIDFQTGNVHEFQAAGRNLGPTDYNASFAWGALRAGSGQSIDFAGGPGAAQYFGLFELDGGLAQLANLHSDGADIYYLASNAGNAYLRDRSYTLSGGGELLPFMTPEPGTAVLFGFAIVLCLCAVKLQSQRP